MNSIISYGVNAISALSDRSDDNENKNFQEKNKSRKTLPVMKSEERLHSQNLLRDAIQIRRSKPLIQPENKKSLMPKMSDYSVRRQLNTKDSDTAALKKSEDHVSISTSIQTEPDERKDFRKERLQDKILPEKLLSVLEAIETNLGSRRSNEVPSENLHELQDISLQLTDSEKLIELSKALNVQDRNKIRTSLEFLEGYFESDSESGNPQNDISDALHQIITRLDNLPANNGMVQAPSSASESHCFDGIVVSETDNLQILRSRKRDQNQLDEEMPESASDNDKGNRSAVSSKRFNSAEKMVSSNAKGMVQRSAKNVDDEKRDDTLPLITIRSV